MWMLLWGLGVFALITVESFYLKVIVFAFILFRVRQNYKESKLDNLCKLVAVVCDGDDKGVYITDYLIQKGDKVVFCSRLPTAFNSLKEKHSDKVIPIQYHSDHINTITKTLKEHLQSPLDSIINFTNHLEVIGPLIDLEDRDMTQALQRNVVTPWRLLKLLFPLLRKGGRIVHIISENGVIKNPTPFSAPGSMTSIANYGLARGLNQELSGLGYKSIVVVEPGLRLPNTVEHVVTPNITDMWRGPLEAFLRIKGEYSTLDVSPDVFGENVYSAVHSVYPRAQYTGLLNVYAVLDAWLPEWIIDFTIKKAISSVR
eukprot:TRINITY_DN2660_c0_g3_i1.p1 TRINITY_DN2660_c0_g3~~TRINITY_DN2660_c0_g3_i1.p1  ORF type:complete len:315 (-),score=62.03 TRINITY_DN2660_c0_g3_i1:81-1025(-)